VLTNGPRTAIGRIGQALEFDGVDDEVSVLDANSLDFSTNIDFSLSIWFKQIGADGEINFFNKVGATSGWDFDYRRTNTDVRLVLKGGVGLFCTIRLTGQTFDDKAWHHFAVVVYRRASCTTDDILIYKDGLKQSPIVAGSDVNTDANQDNTIDLAIGEVVAAGLSNMLDEARIYNRALTADEIKRLYRIGATLKVNAPRYTGSLDTGLVGSWSFDGPDMSATKALDRSGQGNDGVLTNGPRTAIGRIGQAMEFDGVDDYVDIGAGPTSVNTVSFWVYPKTTTEYFVNLTGTTDYIWVDAGTITATGVASPTIYVDGIISSTLVAERWQHVAVVTTTSENASNLDIGRTQDANNMDGLIDDVRIYNRALSADEIKRLYNIGR
jgi:hypothetical protein